MLCLRFVVCVCVSFLAHTTLCTPDPVEAYLKPTRWQGGRKNGRMSEGGRAQYFSIHISTVAFLVYFNLHPQKPFSCLKSESLNCSLRSDYSCLIHVSYMSVSVSPVYIQRNTDRQNSTAHGGRGRKNWICFQEALISHYSSPWNTLWDTEQGPR